MSIERIDGLGVESSEPIFSGEVVDRANRPDFIFNPSNDGWFGSWGSPQFVGQARMRAIEEGLPVIRSTTTGISAVIDPRGVVRAAIATGKADAVVGFVPEAEAPTDLLVEGVEQLLPGRRPGEGRPLVEGAAEAALVDAGRYARGDQCADGDADAKEDERHEEKREEPRPPQTPAPSGRPGGRRGCGFGRSSGLRQGARREPQRQNGRECRQGEAKTR